MIGIQLDGDNEFLETEPGTTISMHLENPIFGDADKLSPGSYSLPFNIPGGDRSPKNSAKLKNPDVIENNESYQIHKAKLFVAGIPFKSGNLKVQESSKKNLSSYFTFGLNTINENFKTAKLRDVVNEQFSILSSTGKEIYIKKIGSGNATIEINGVSFTDDSLSGISVLIQNYFNANQIVDGGVYLPWSDLITSGNTPLGMTPTYIRLRNASLVEIIPGFPSINYNTDTILPLAVKIPSDQVSKWQVEAADLSSDYANFQTFINTHHSGNKLRFPVRFNGALHGNETVRDLDIINGVDSSGLIKNDPNWGIQNGQGILVKNYNSIQPFVLTKYVLDRIANQFGFQYEGDFYEIPDLATQLIDNTITLDVLMDYVGDRKFIFWKRVFNINELIPDITVVDFFKALQSRYNLAVYFNEQTKRVRLQTREPIATSYEHDDITEISSPIQTIKEERLTGFTIRVKKEKTDALSFDQEIIIGASEKEIEILCGNIQTIKEIIVAGGIVRGVEVAQKNRDDFSLRIFHYRGIVDNGVFQYHSSDVNGYDLIEDIASVGPDLYKRFWQYWLLFHKNRLFVKTKVNFSLRKLLRFDWELKRRFDRNNYIIKSIDLKISNQGLEVSEVELYTMR